MRAVYYEKNGTAREVLRVGEVDTPQAGPGEVRVKLATSGVNPSDVKSRHGLDPQDRLSARDPAERRRRRHRPGRRRRRQIAHRRARLGLERAMEARLRHRRRIHRAAGGAGGEAAGQRELRSRRLPRHSGDDRLSRGGAGRCRQGHDPAGLRRRRRGQPIRHPVRQGAGRNRHRHGFLGRRRRQPRAKPAPTTRSTTSATMSANA